MVRYADDLICLCQTNSACTTAHELVSQALLKEGLTVPPVGPESKSRIYAPDDPADFLGLQLRPQNGDYLLEISAQQTQKIRQRIVNFEDIDTLNKQGTDFTRFLRRLDGVLAGYSGAYEFAANAKHLEVVLESARSEAINQLLTKIFGSQVTELRCTVNRSHLQNSQTNTRIADSGSMVTRRMPTPLTAYSVAVSRANPRFAELAGRSFSVPMLMVSCD